ncbi:hypothetical protein IGJ78_002430 [Enterococcus sp. DIV2447a]|uniref:DUF916 and DUF3324 domain-containing protein n=1 Tax=unclassified Enterococcus TaxID=2608891 RepID=UPI003D2FB83B
MKRNCWCTMAVFFFIIGSVCFAQRVQAEENMTTKFTVNPILPKNQVAATQSYYDLIVTNGQTQKLELALINKTNEELTVDLAIANATTNVNGLIVYNDLKTKPDRSMENPLTSLIYLPNKQVKIPAKQTVLAQMFMEIPSKGLKGVVLGGIYATLASEKEEARTVTGLTSRYGFNVAITLRSSEKVPMYLAETLQLTTVVPKIERGSKTVQAVIQNPTAAIFPEVSLEGQITKKGESKKIAKRVLSIVRFAPNTVMNFNIDLGKKNLQPGTYVFEGTARLKADENQGWHFKREFKITNQQAKALNKEASIKLVLPKWWIPTFYGLLAITVIAIILAIKMSFNQYLLLKQLD